LRKASRQEYLNAYRAAKRWYRSLEGLDEKMPPLLVSLSGELLVKSKLAERSIAFISRGGQVGYDILLEGENGSRKKVEAR